MFELSNQLVGICKIEDVTRTVLVYPKETLREMQVRFGVGASVNGGQRNNGRNGGGGNVIRGRSGQGQGDMNAMTNIYKDNSHEDNEDNTKLNGHAAH